MKNSLFYYIVALLGLLFYGNGISQTIIEGKVLDYESKQALPFVNVITYTDGKIGGTTTDVNGDFKLTVPSFPDSLIFSFIGYQRQVYTRMPSKWVYLKENENELATVEVYQGVNPALRIIRNAIDHGKENNVNYHHSYINNNYTLFTADVDQKNFPKMDSLSDSLTIKIVEFFQKRAAFRMETYSEVHHKPIDKKKETILATRTSGLKNPMFAAIASQIQSFSAYDNPVPLMQSEYLNPVSNGGYSGYYFILQDTLYEGKDSVFIIDFHPKRGKDFKGLRGKLFIHSANWAIENVIFEFASLFGIVGSEDNPITVAMSYHYIPEKAVWFPAEAKTTIPLKMQISDQDSVKIDSINSRKISGFILSNTTTYKNIQIDPDEKLVKTAGSPVKVDEKASERSEQDWYALRGDSLTAREKETYHYVDSVSKEAKFEKKLDGLQQIMKGNIRLGWFDMSILRIVQFNNFEGFRLGFGGETNEKLIPWLSIGAYGAYGFKDKRWKYGGDLTFHANKAQSFDIHLLYHDDVQPTGYFTIPNQDGLLSSTNLYRGIYTNRMNYEQNLGIEVGSYVYKNIYLSAFNYNKRIWSVYNYSFNDPNKISDGRFFEVVETGLRLNWKIGFKYIQLPKQRISLDLPKYPVVSAAVVKGWNTIWFGKYNYVRTQLQIDQRFKIQRMGTIYLQGNFSKVWGNVPLPLLLYTPGTYDKNLGVTAPNNLETVRPAEFLNDQLAIGHFRLEFNPFKSKKGKFAPILALRFSAAWGSLSNASYHQNLTFSTMQKGYYETGFVLDNLLKVRGLGLGIGYFYRLGNYQFTKQWYNMAIKLSIRFNFLPN